MPSSLRGARFAAHLLVALCALSISACATLFSETSQQVTITSNVTGAEVLFNGRPVGRTPFTTTMKKETFAEWVVTLRDPGYQTRELRLQKTLNKVSLFNLCSAFSWVTDALTGAMIEYSPGSYYLELTPRGAPVAASATRDARHFVVTNRSLLLRDVAAGGGEYLDAFFTLLDVRAEDMPAVRAALRAQLEAMLAERYPDQLFLLMQGIARRV